MTLVDRDLEATVARGTQSRLFRERLVQQQFWLFGADIRRPEGNLLLEMGFKRYRCLDPASGSSCYVCDTMGAVSMHLWGFGCCATQASGERIYLSRHKAGVRRLPDWIELESLHTSTELDRWCDSPHDLSVCDAHEPVFDWFGRYERSVLDRVGLIQRESTLAALGPRQVCSASSIPELWDLLARPHA